MPQDVASVQQYIVVLKCTPLNVLCKLVYSACHLHLESGAQRVHARILPTPELRYRISPMPTLVSCTKNVFVSIRLRIRLTPEVDRAAPNFTGHDIGFTPRSVHRHHGFVSDREELRHSV